MTVEQLLTSADEYTNSYIGKYLTCYQIHIFSFNKIFSTYFNTNNITKEQVKINAESVVSEIRKRSEGKNKGFLFERDGKFLISENENLFDYVELYEFNPEFVRYEPCYDYDDFFDFIGDAPVEIFLKNAFITVGAEELYSVIEPQITRLIEIQISDIKQFNDWRELDRKEPKYIVEIYKIEKNYVPVKVQEIQSNNFEITLSLPEYRYIVKSGQRMAYVAKDITSGKTIESTLKDKIESIKYNKWLNKNPTLIDLEDMARMELDSDDPNFLSYKDFTQLDEDEFEEGDDEYTPQ